MDIEGRNVKVPNGISVSLLIVKIRDIAFDTGKKTIKKAASTEYWATLNEAELTRYLTSKYPNVPGLKISLNNGTIGLAASPAVSVIKVGLQADAALEIRDERTLVLNLKSLKVAGIGTPDFAREYIDSKLGTIFDARDLGFDARIKDAVIDRGTLTLSGGSGLDEDGSEEDRALAAAAAMAWHIHRPLRFNVRARKAIVFFHASAAASGL